jgi:hypothetical protein
MLLALLQIITDYSNPRYFVGSLAMDLQTLFTELPRRRVLGNRASGSERSRNTYVDERCALSDD